MSFFYNSSEAYDLCYRAAIGRDRCRGLEGSDPTASEGKCLECRAAKATSASLAVGSPRSCWRRNCQSCVRALRSRGGIISRTMAVGGSALHWRHVSGEPSPLPEDARSEPYSSYSPDFTFKRLIAEKKIALHDRTSIRKLVLHDSRDVIVAVMNAETNGWRHINFPATSDLLASPFGNRELRDSSSKWGLQV